MIINIIAPWLKSQTLEVQTRTLSILGGASTKSSRIVVRWLSWIVLTKNHMRKVTIRLSSERRTNFGQGIADTHPPLEDLLPLFSGNGRGETSAAFKITSKTNYMYLAMRTEILGHLLSELEGFASPVGDGDFGTANSKASDLELIVHALSDLHPQIRK